VNGNAAYVTNGYYPWNPSTPSAINRAPATLGQLKAVFALRFDSLHLGPPIVDTDGDGMDDKWEALYFGDLSQTATGDLDSDGLNNANEVGLGTNPLLADSDGDQVNDFLDFFPLDETRSNAPVGQSGDNTAPTIILIEPLGAIPTL
jgi:hypothetical protein